MQRIELFTKEDIESYGFIYEIDDSKCRMSSAKVIYGTFYVKDGIVDYGGSGVGEYDFMMDKATRDLAASCIGCKHIHSIFVDIFTQADQELLNNWNKNYHGHMRVAYRGHSPYTQEEMNERIEKYKILTKQLIEKHHT